MKKKSAANAAGFPELRKPDLEMLKMICIQIKTQGFVPLSQLTEQFGPDKVTMAVATLYRQLRVLREARRPWKDGTSVLGYEWADRRFSKAEITKIPPDWGFVVELMSEEARRPRYADFALIALRCRWLSEPLGGMPSGDNKLAFLRDVAGRVFLPAYCVKAMLRDTAPLIGKEMAAVRHIRVANVVIEHPKIEDRQRPVVDQGQGKGINVHEALAAGTEFVIEAWVPLSAFTEGEYLRMVQLAGKYVRLSPARSTGNGEFEVLGEA